MLYNLGALYKIVADYENAEVFYNKCLAIKKQLYGNKADPDIASS